MRKIYLLGENHLKNRVSELSGPGITNEKLREIHSQQTNKGKNIIIFGESVKVKKYFIPEEKVRIPITETRSIIEGLFQALNFFLMMRKEEREKGLDKVTLHKPISKLLNGPLLKLNITADNRTIVYTPEQVKRTASNLFNLIFQQIMFLITTLPDKTEMEKEFFKTLEAEETRGNLMYENITEEHFSVMYKFSYRFVDNAIVSNVETYNVSQPQDTIFCIVVGQDHIQNIYNVLKSKREYNIRYIPEWEGLEYIKTIGGRKNKKNRTTIRKNQKKSKTRRKI
jgi:hypothetical protein